ncbi:WBM0748 family T4SS-associated protein [Wolbachia endosymbiont of Ctenocephalides felis wCfeT]|uniref:WBM0748 family T4SS-associated protein n=1 Tax=Wolbachia endosymbiont of Ctenocephalides felis wCfeT TaxID=2732593 RepID=UPI001FE8E1E0|nr:hypothetical protein [Wolbachia endosymbiont of Ctenocephalides felis wCfeT]
MSIKNEIYNLIKQQFHIKYFDIKYQDNYLARVAHRFAIESMHDSAASQISNSIALCIVGSGECQVQYKNIADAIGITREEIRQCNIESISSKINSEAEREGSEFFQMLSRFDQSLREYSEKSIMEILNLSAEQMLKAFCGEADETNPSFDRNVVDLDSAGEEGSDTGSDDSGSSDEESDDSDDLGSSYGESSDEEYDYVLLSPPYNPGSDDILG